VIDEVPSVQDLRWPVLVVLDALGDDELLDLEERVAQHLELSDDARNAVDPDSDRRFFLKRIEQALEDLYQAGAIEPDGDGLSLHITDVGRRFTEPQAQELREVVPSARPTDQASSPTEDKPSVGDWIVTLIETFLP
jgi:restriction endonuclease Mrr